MHGNIRQTRYPVYGLLALKICFTAEAINSKSHHQGVCFPSILRGYL